MQARVADLGIEGEQNFECAWAVGQDKTHSYGSISFPGSCFLSPEEIELWELGCVMICRVLHAHAPPSHSPSVKPVTQPRRLSWVRHYSREPVCDTCQLKTEEARLESEDAIRLLNSRKKTSSLQTPKDGLEKSVREKLRDSAKMGAHWGPTNVGPHFRNLAGLKRTDPYDSWPSFLECFGAVLSRPGLFLTF